MSPVPPRPAQVQQGEERVCALGRGIVVTSQHGAQRKQLSVHATEALAQPVNGVAASGDEPVGAFSIHVSPLEETEWQIAT